MDTFHRRNNQKKGNRGGDGQEKKKVTGNKWRGKNLARSDTKLLSFPSTRPMKKKWRGQKPPSPRIGAHRGKWQPEGIVKHLQEKEDAGVTTWEEEHSQ